jgi:1-acyl-sn-glycerol-3-phosphate acyltransferase
MLILRSLLFAAGMWLSTIFFAPFAVLTFPFPLEVRYRFIRQWARFNLWWLGVSCALRYRVEGRDNIPPGPAIVFCKHESAWETLALQNVFPHQVWLLKRELLWIPFFGWGLAMLRPIAIDRRAGTRAVTQLVDQGTSHLRGGRWVIIFPEGTRVPPGETGRYGIGGAVLASRSGFPVVPVAHNAGEFWPRKGFLKRPGTIVLSVGPLIESRGKTAEQIRDEAKMWIEKEAARLHASRGESA